MADDDDLKFVPLRTRTVGLIKDEIDEQIALILWKVCNNANDDKTAIEARRALRELVRAENQHLHEEIVGLKQQLATEDIATRLEAIEKRIEASNTTVLTNALRGARKALAEIRAYVLDSHTGSLSMLARADLATMAGDALERINAVLPSEPTS